MIPVTKPYLPQLEMYVNHLEGIWTRNWFTNNGPVVNELELRLKAYLDIENLLFVSNGTIALQIAIKALRLRGEIITTPFSFVATSSSIVWEQNTPIFVDIDPHSLNIDPTRIEDAISQRTCAIVATHAFGNACDIDAINLLAKKNNIPVIYDAAHGFGTKYKAKSIFCYGDVSTASFHATKLFHSVEGGAIFANDILLEQMSIMRNFGHDGPYNFKGLGINGKNSEIHAAMGLCVLEVVNSLLRKRKEQCLYYDSVLRNLNVSKPRITKDCDFNYAYYPIIFNSERWAMEAKKKLELSEIYPKRYFYPSLSSLAYVGDFDTPMSDQISSCVLCLPLYHDLDIVDQDMIASILLSTQNKLI